MSKKEVLNVKSMDEIKKGVTEEDITEYLKNELRNRAVNALVENKFMGALADSFAKIELQNTAVRDMVMNLRTFTDFRKLKYMRGNFEKRVEAIREGLRGMLWGAEIWVVKDLPYGEVRLYEKDEVNKDYPFITKSKILILALTK